jgi:hypothetical protein
MAIEVETRKVKVTAEDASACVDALMAIDAEVRSQQGGAIGTGIYALLELVGTQLMGLPRTPGFTPEPPTPPATLAETEKEPLPRDPHKPEPQPRGASEVKHEPPKPAPHAPAPNRR